jgi:Zn-dependent protease
LLAFLTNGKIWFLIPGGIILHFQPGHRIGWVRYSVNLLGIGVVAISGAIANLVLAVIFRALFELTAISIFNTAFILNLIWALWNVIPFPPADGNRLFFGSRLAYMWSLAFVIMTSILLYSKINIIITVLAAFLFGWVWWLIYYVVWERFNWKGPY